MSTEVPIYLISFRLAATSPTPDLYTLVYGDDDLPLLRSGRITLFEQSEHAMDAFALLPVEVRSAADPPNEVAYAYDLPLALDKLAKADVDPSRQLLNCLNVMFDFVKAVGGDLPMIYKDAMSKFANHLTFSEEYGSFLKEEGIDRATIRDGLYWCLGLVAMHATILRESPAPIAQ